MKIRFYNAKILTMQSEDIITGELHTDGDKITFAGSENIPQGSFRPADLEALLPQVRVERLPGGRQP